MKINKEYLKWYLMLMVPILGTIIFNIYPVIVTFIDSFKNMQGDFIGSVNYEIIFNDREFITSIENTIYMGVIGVVINIPLAFTLAVMLNKITKFKEGFKVIFLLPMVMSMVTVGILFKFIFMPDESGIANYFLSYLGLGPFSFFNLPKTARESVVAMALWKGLGYNIIIFFAGLQLVPTELYEAAEIDGANEFKKWLHITIPSMKNTFIFVYITSTIAVLKRFTEVYAIGGESGNPAGSINTVMLYIYRKSFSTLNYKDLGIGAAASMILFLIILIITIFNFILVEENNFLNKLQKKTKKIAKFKYKKIKKEKLVKGNLIKEGGIK